MKWKSVRLGEITRAFISGGTPDTKTAEFWTGRIPWITGADVVDGKVNLGRRFISESAVQNSAANIVPKGSVLIVTRTGVGKIAIAQDDIAISQDLTGIVVKDGFVPNFVMWAILGQIGSLISIQRGATIKGVLREDVARLPIPFTGISEQRRIVQLLEQADGLRRKRAEADMLADRMLPALFRKMFGDPLANDKGWPVARFGEIAESRLGKMLDAKQQTGVHRRPYLRNLNVQWARFDLSSVLEMDFPPEQRDEFLLRKGDLLICEGGEVGRSAIWDGQVPECYFQKALHRVRPHADKCVAEYVVYLLWALARRGGLIDLNSKATIPHLTGVQLAGLQIPLPPVELQMAFAGLVQRVSAGTQKRLASGDNLAALFRTMLHRAFNGELTAKWREAHLKELLVEMEQQARLLKSPLEE
ncbi:MAG: restriction endonuclease subunit S [Limisphaerales bacterium]